jgi:hypothetical protein
MKKLLLALCVATSLNLPAFATPEVDESPGCITPADISAQAIKLGLPVFGNFYNLTSPTGFHVDQLLIFELPDGRFSLVWFDKNEEEMVCYAGYQDIDEKTLNEDVLPGVMRKAGQPA